jgi:hypothetical protein
MTAVMLGDLAPCGRHDSAYVSPLKTAELIKNYFLQINYFENFYNNKLVKILKIIIFL